MLDSITFIDLIALTRITPESTVEKFGGLINSSFFDASNILGTLKQRGLIDFVTSFPSQSAISVTEEGKKLVAEAQEKAAAPFDTLDMTILVQLSNGLRSLQDIMSGVNVTPKDLAFHLYKLSQQQFASYELRNGNMSITLTEKGFLRVKEGVPKESAQQAQQQEQQQPKPTEIITDATAKLQTNAQAQPKTYNELHDLETKIVNAKRARLSLSIMVILVIIVLLLLYYLTTIHVI